MKEKRGDGERRKSTGEEERKAVRKEKKRGGGGVGMRVKEPERNSVERQWSAETDWYANSGRQ